MVEFKGISREYVSLMKRTLEEQLYNELIQDYGFPRAICRSLTELFYSYLNLYLQGYLVPDIARKTSHSETAVDRYIKSFNKVRMLKDRLDVKEISRTLEMSEYLVKEYLEIMDEWKGGDSNA